MRVPLSSGPPFLPSPQWFRMRGYWDHVKVSIFLESQLTYQPFQRRTRSEIYFKISPYSCAFLSHFYMLCASVPHLTVSHAHICVPFPYLVIITLQADLKFGVEQGVDMVFASFTRKQKDVSDCHKELGEKGKHILIISKVTTPQKL